MDKWWDFVDMVMKLWFRKMQELASLVEELLVSQEPLPTH
jgi:hypothetical protein